MFFFSCCFLKCFLARDSAQVEPICERQGAELGSHWPAAALSPATQQHSGESLFELSQCEQVSYVFFFQVCFFQHGQPRAVGYIKKRMNLKRAAFLTPCFFTAFTKNSWFVAKQMLRKCTTRRKPMRLGGASRWTSYRAFCVITKGRFLSVFVLAHAIKERERAIEGHTQDSLLGNINAFWIIFAQDFTGFL